jgi:hypothetical protein
VEHAHGNPGDAAPLTADVLLKRTLALLGTGTSRA